LQDSVPPDPLDRASERLLKANRATDALEYASVEDWDMDTGRHEVHVHVPQPSQPDVERSTSDAPAKPTVWHITLTGVRKFPPWGAVLVALAIIAAYVTLRLRGLAP
jgi:hypothetical protein